MTNAEINEVMVVEIKDLLLKYDIFHGTNMYFNGKRLKVVKGEIVVKDDVNVIDYCTWCNPDMITISYEGDNSLYLLINGYFNADDKDKANKVIDELNAIGDKYNRYFEIGDDTTLFFISTDDDTTSISFDETPAEDVLTKFYYPKED